MKENRNLTEWPWASVGKRTELVLYKLFESILFKYAQLYFEKKITNYSFMYNVSQFKSIFKDCW